MRARARRRLEAGARCGGRPCVRLCGPLDNERSVCRSRGRRRLPHWLRRRRPPICARCLRTGRTLRLSEAVGDVAQPRLRERVCISLRCLVVSYAVHTSSGQRSACIRGAAPPTVRAACTGARLSLAAAFVCLLCAGARRIALRWCSTYLQLRHLLLQVEHLHCAQRSAARGNPLATQPDPTRRVPVARTAHGTGPTVLWARPPAPTRAPSPMRRRRRPRPADSPPSRPPAHPAGGTCCASATSCGCAASAAAVPAAPNPYGGRAPQPAQARARRGRGRGRRPKTGRRMLFRACDRRVLAEPMRRAPCVAAPAARTHPEWRNDRRT